MKSSFAFFGCPRLALGLLGGLLAALSGCADGGDGPGTDTGSIVTPGGLGGPGGTGATPGGTGGAGGTTGGNQPGGSPTAGGLPGTQGGAGGGFDAGSPTGGPGGMTGGRDGGPAATDGGGGVTGAGDGGGDLSALAAPLPTGTPKMGWSWVQVAGSVCRDGSPAGYFWRRGKNPNLMIFMNGGGACSDPFFCGLNPVNVNQDLPTQSLIDATGNVLLGPDGNPQFPHEEGVFKRDTRNPVGEWNMIYIPYCTGDVFAGSKPDGTVPGVDGKQQFVGYKNVGLFLDSFGPSFANTTKVLLTGSSAGGFGTLLNYDRVQMYFDKQPGKARVYGVTDSGIPFRQQYMAPCLQKRWRDSWDLVMPEGCTSCTPTGGLTEGIGTYLFKEKYKDRVLGGMISAVEDGVIRAFYGPGLGECTNDPGTNAILSALNLGGYSGADFRAGLKDALDFVGKDKVHSFFIDSWEHMHLWRARYYDTINGTTIAAWLGNILADKPPQHVGSL
jgi:Pectinacetylesterase